MTLGNCRGGARLDGRLQSQGRRRRAWLLLPVAALAGCVTGRALLESRVDMGGASPAKTMLVILNARSSHFKGLAYDSFVSSLKQRLWTCDVNVTVHDVGALELNVSQDIAKVMLQTKPELLVTMVGNGGDLTQNSTGNITLGNLYYAVSAKHMATSREVWKARLTYGLGMESEKVGGERLAAALVARMATDGLVAGCPANVVTPDLGEKLKPAT